MAGIDLGGGGCSMLENEEPSTLFPANLVNFKRRSEERSRCRAGMIASLIGKEGAEPIEVWVRDLSPSGLGFTVATPPNVGQEVVIRLKKHAIVAAIRLDAIVVHCTAESEHCWHVGCIFKESLSDVIVEYLSR